MSKISRFLKVRLDAARKVSHLTGKSVCFHFFDCCKCNVMYGCRCYQYSDMGFYRFPSFQRSRMMTSGHLQKVLKYNDQTKLHFFNCKSEFNKYFDKYVRRGWLNCKYSTPDQISNFLSQYQIVIVKPNNGEAGKSVNKIFASKVDVLDYSRSIAGDDLVMEECVTLHPSLSFGSSAVNTIRMATMVDKNGSGQILTASIRCGIGDTVVDNWSAGGVAYPINLDYGRIESYGMQADNMDIPVYIHPGTDTFMPGQVIPFWNEAKNMVLDACEVFPSVRYVGWDIAITPNGPLLIEGNPSPGFATLEGIGNTRGIYGLIEDLI